MKLPRIVDATVPDQWTDRNQMVRAALDCFAPLAITIRAKPDCIATRDVFEPLVQQAVR